MRRLQIAMLPAAGFGSPIERIGVNAGDRRGRRDAAECSGSYWRSVSCMTAVQQKQEWYAQEKQTRTHAQSALPSWEHSERYNCRTKSSEGTGELSGGQMV